MTSEIHNAQAPLAHIASDRSGRWLPPQTLREHLENVSRLAGEFASEFSSGEIGSLLGLAHDLGKWSPEWQNYFRNKTGFPGDKPAETFRRVEHSIYGAKVLETNLGRVLGRVFGFPIAGHHSGLADLDSQHNPAASLLGRLSRASIEPVPDEAIEFISRAFHNASYVRRFSSNSGIDLSLWIRMLFSCLVDADRLDAERYESPDKATLRSRYLSIADLTARFDVFMKQKRVESTPSRVNDIRDKVHAECVKAASLPKGVFSLSVPTGGGKTLSSLAFALKHARLNEQRRIIYVIPYTSIIEQNAQVFKDALGDDQVVEHHSNVVEDEGSGRKVSRDSVPSEYSDDVVTDKSLRRRLAIENWDAPIIVTTSVQFFESLFSDSPSRCRKLHNIANSVVILDEAQLVPTEFLKPILEALGLLVKDYGVTLLICTATQPAFGKRIGFPGLGELPITEIVQDVPNLYKDLKRVEYEMPEKGSPAVSWKDLAAEISGEHQVLCVVSDRRSCRELHALMPSGTYHLSALMCPEHRSDVISEVKGKLRSGECVRVVSTQLVEAGVDLDFPVVYRAMAGLDSIVQAGGRCNREGRLGRSGRVKVFVPERRPPAGILRKATDVTRELLLTCGEDISSPAVFVRFFEHLYSRANTLDTKEICRLLAPSSEGLRFRSAAFEMIRNGDVSIAVPYLDGEKVLEEIRRKGFPDYRDLRRLQRYIVTVPPAEFDLLSARDSLDEIVDGLWALVNDKEYSDTIGLLVREIENDVSMFVSA